MYSLYSGGAKVTQSVLRLDCGQDGSLFKSRRRNLLLFGGLRGYFLVVKQPGRDSDHSSPSAFELNMSRRSEYTSSMCIRQDSFIVTVFW